jgi:cytidine deaminase
MSQPLGVFTLKTSLSVAYHDLVERTMQACHHAHCFRSNFPVGAAILACSEAGQVAVFDGSNVENESFPATICAERNAATTASQAGYRRFIAVAVFCQKYPGGSPCGLCRDMIKHFDSDTDILNICDHDGNVRLFKARDLLPAPRGTRLSWSTMDRATKQMIARATLDNSFNRMLDRVQALCERSYVPYSKQARGALFFADDANGRRRSFVGMNIDNASYGGSVCAEQVAMSSARSAGCIVNPFLVVSGADPINGESLQMVREFGLHVPVLVVLADRSATLTDLEQLLPDSFGPDALA